MQMSGCGKKVQTNVMSSGFLPSPFDLYEYGRNMSNSGKSACFHSNLVKLSFGR